jgi:hypothetical protein
MSQASTVKRTAKSGRVCVEVVLKFYTQIDHKLHAKAEKAVAELRDNLVKWVVAPNKDAVRKWLEETRLGEHLDVQPHEMSAAMSETFGHEQGVDIILDKSGAVMSPENFDPAQWRQSIMKAAEVHYGAKPKWKTTEEGNGQIEWRSGKYRIWMRESLGQTLYCLGHTAAKGGMERSIGDHASLELAMISALRDMDGRPAA